MDAVRQIRALASGTRLPGDQRVMSGQILERPVAILSVRRLEAAQNYYDQPRERATVTADDYRSSPHRPLPAMSHLRRTFTACQAIKRGCGASR